MKSVTKFDRAQFWRHHISRRRALNSRVTQYCRAEGLSPFTFRYWEKKLGGGSRPLPAFVPVEVVPVLPTAKETLLPDAKWLAEFILHLGALHGGGR